MSSPFQSRFLGNEFEPAVGADIPRPDENLDLLSLSPLSQIDSGPIDLFAPDNINRLILNSTPFSPTSNTSKAGASAPLDLFEIGSAGPLDSIEAGTTTPGAMFDMARGFLGDVVSQGPALATITNVAGIAGPEMRGTARGFGRMARGAGLFGFGPIGIGLGALTVGRGLFDVVESVVPGIRNDINDLTFDLFGFDVFGQQQAVQQALQEDPFGFADFSGFGDFDVEAAEEAAAGFETGVSGEAADFGDFGDAESGGGLDSAGGFGSGGGDAGSEGESEAESGGGDSDF